MLGENILSKKKSKWKNERNEEGKKRRIKTKKEKIVRKIYYLLKNVVI